MIPQEKNKVNTVEAKNRFNALVTQAIDKKEPIFVERRGEPVAVILDYESYKKSLPKEKKSESSLIKEFEAWHKYMKKKYPQGTGDSVEIIREIREERSER